MHNANCRRCGVGIADVNALSCPVCRQPFPVQLRTSPLYETDEEREARRPTDRYFTDPRRSNQGQAQRDEAAAAPIWGSSKQNCSGEILGWLTSARMAPLPVGQVPILTMGRSMDNDLVLPHKRVSRRHAWLQVIRDVLYLNDFSVNGTTVNGRRAVFTRLRAGDVITLGPYTFRYVSNKQARQNAAQESGEFRA